jgi:hypothetical protein
MPPYPDSLSAMVYHAISLAIRVVQAFATSLGGNVLGMIFVPLIFVILVFLYTLYTRLRKQGISFTLETMKETLKSQAKATSVIALAVYVSIFLWTGIRTVWLDHHSLVTERDRLRYEVARLERKRHTIDISDPVFSNIVHLLRSFQTYRRARQGAPCVIKVTAPRGANALAHTVAQLSNSVSDCFTFGPDDSFDLNPDLEKEAVGGMVPDGIVFHAARDDRAANQLFTSLGNEVTLVRSYQLPIKPTYQIPNLPGRIFSVWLQFGTNVRWNSELH